MKLRLEATEKEIKDFLVRRIILQKDIFLSVSKFYPNRVNSEDLLNGQIDAKNPIGRVYVEIGNPDFQNTLGKLKG